MPQRTPDFVVPRVLRGLPAGVFADPRARRYGRLRLGLLFALVLFAAWVTLFFVEIWHDGDLTPVRAPEEAGILSPSPGAHKHLHGLEPPGPHGAQALLSDGNTPNVACPALEAARRRPVFAFAPSSSQHAPFSLSQDCGLIDVLLPEWATLTAPQGAAQLDMETAAARMPIVQATRKGIATWPVVNVTPDYLAVLAKTSSQLGAEFETLQAVALEQDWPGYCLDFSALVGTPLSGRVALLRDWMQRSRASDMERCAIFPAGTEAGLLQSAGRVAERCHRQGLR